MYREVDICIHMYVYACTYSTGKGGQDTRMLACWWLAVCLEPLSDCPSVVCSTARVVVVPRPSCACTSRPSCMGTGVAAFHAPARLSMLHAAMLPVPRQRVDAPGVLFGGCARCQTPQSCHCLIKNVWKDGLGSRRRMRACTSCAAERAQLPACCTPLLRHSLLRAAALDAVLSTA